jgi:hypothetical protein
MKKLVILGLVGTLLLSSVGCQAKASTTPTDSEKLVIEEGKDLTDSNGNCITVEPGEPIEYEIENHQMFKESAIIDEIESMKHEEGHFTFVYEGSQYVAVFAGERNTGGYSIEVDSVVGEDGKVFIYALESKPDSDMMVTQALTYPLSVVKLINFEATEDTEFAVGIYSEDDEVNGGEDYYISPTDDIEIGGTITIGEIMQIDGEYVHIIGGDLVQVYEYNPENMEAFFLGQTVELIKGEEDNYLKTYAKDDYSISHTNMGHIINQVSGTLKTLGEDSIKIESEGKDIEILSYSPVNYEIGTDVTAYTATFDVTPSIIMIISEESKLELTVAELSRSENGGLDLLLKDENEGEYRMNLSYVSCEFDISKVVVGDVLTVYHQGIMESWPMQLDTVLVRK